MTRAKHLISYSPLEVPARTFWTVHTDLPPEKAGTLCVGLRGTTTERHGACFYYPDEKNGQIRCRYEWQIPWNGKKYGVRLGIQFAVTTAAIGDLELYAAHGDEHPDVGKAPSFSDHDLAFLRKKIDLVLKEALDRQREDKKQQYNVVYYLEIPPLRKFEAPVRLEQFGATVIPTVILGKDNKRISAVILSVSASFKDEARNSALRRFMVLCSLFTLAEGAAFKQLVPDWPRNRRPRDLLNRIDPLPKTEEIYPHRRWRACPDRLDPNLLSRVQTIANLYSALGPNDVDDITDPIFAYMSGKEIQGKQPTLATIAYIAALSSFASSKICPGNVSCSICGALRQEGGAMFHHNILGDRRSLVHALADLFEVKPETDKYSDLVRLVSKLYGKHRSAYVHGATLRHGEYSKSGPAPIAEPSGEGLFPELYSYYKELLTLEGITRKALILSLANRSGLPLDRELFDLTTIKFHVEIPVQMQATLPGKTTLVQFKLPPVDPGQAKG